MSLISTFAPNFNIIINIKTSDNYILYITDNHNVVDEHIIKLSLLHANYVDDVILYDKFKILEAEEVLKHVYHVLRKNIDMSININECGQIKIDYHYNNSIVESFVIKSN